MARARAVAAPVRDGVGLGVAVGLSGVAFGATAVTAGLSVSQACVLSLFAFTGASQFALAGVVAAGGNVIAGTLGALLLASRNMLYGLRLSGLLDLAGVGRLLAAQGVIDETSAVAFAQPDPHRARLGFLATFASIYTGWNVTTFLGAVAVTRVPSPRLMGLDVVGPATFLALLWPRLWSSGLTRLLALLSAGLALATVPILPAGTPVLLAGAAAVAFATLVRGPR